jgi:hypothetical protein
VPGRRERREGREVVAVESRPVFHATVRLKRTREGIIGRPTVTPESASRRNDEEGRISFSPPHPLGDQNRSLFPSLSIVVS